MGSITNQKGLLQHMCLFRMEEMNQMVKLSVAQYVGNIAIQRTLWTFTNLDITSLVKISTHNKLFSIMYLIW